MRGGRCSVDYIKPYKTVHTGPKTHPGGANGGCFSFLYVVDVPETIVSMVT